MLKVIKEYFSTSDKPVEATEMMAFWTSLTPEEKNFFRNAVPLIW